MTASVSLHLAAEPRSVGLVRDVCAAALARLGIAEESIAVVKLAVTEAATNVVDHADSIDDAFDVRLDVVGDWCYVDVFDRGRGFDSQTLTFEAPPAPSVRGRGLSIMRRIVDDIVVSSTAGVGTRVRLAKRLRFAA